MTIETFQKFNVSIVHLKNVCDFEKKNINTHKTVLGRYFKPHMLIFVYTCILVIFIFNKKAFIIEFLTWLLNIYITNFLQFEMERVDYSY